MGHNLCHINRLGVEYFIISHYTARISALLIETKFTLKGM
jgi:hypothetical protein